MCAPRPPSQSLDCPSSLTVQMADGNVAGSFLLQHASPRSRSPDSSSSVLVPGRGSIACRMQREASAGNRPQEEKPRRYSSTSLGIGGGLGGGREGVTPITLPTATCTGHILPTEWESCRVLRVARPRWPSCSPLTSITLLPLPSSCHVAGAVPGTQLCTVSSSHSSEGQACPSPRDNCRKPVKLLEQGPGHIDV